MSEAAIAQAEFARLVGVSRPAVHKAIERGRLAPPAVTADRRLVPSLALKQWNARREPAEDLKARPAASDDPGDSDEYRGAKTLAARIDAERKQLELDRLRDRYRDRDEVVRAMTTAGRRIGQGLDQLAGRAEEIAAAAGGSDVAAVRALLRQVARELRDGLADALTADADQH